MADMTTAKDSETEPQGGVSPYLTVAESASFARRHEQTIRKAIRAYQRDQSTGLKAFQANAHAAIVVHIDDLHRWIRGEAPSRGTRRKAA